MILAGGLGTRLGAIADSTAKAMVTVAGAPFIDHQLRLLASRRVKRVVLCVSHLHEQIEHHVGDGAQFGLHVEYSYDGSTRLGTGGAVRRALPKVGAEFAVMYGDTYLNIDFCDVYKSFKASGAQGLMTVLANSDRWDKSNILFRDGRIEKYDKDNSAKEMKHIDYGLILLSSDAFKNLAAPEAFDLTLLFQDMIARAQMAGHEVFQRFYEIGSPEALEETERYLRQLESSSSREGFPSGI
jgi:NDP-sugar pyrophosphorylase family protein